MSTCHEVMKTAYRRSAVLPAGRQLNAQNVELGMEWIRSFYEQGINAGMFGLISRVMKEGEGPYEANEGEWVSHETTDVITLPDVVLDQGEQRRPRDGAVIITTDSDLGTTIRYLYDATKAAWLNLNTTFADKDNYCPMTGSYEVAIKTMMAVKFAQENGIMPDPLLAKEYAVQKTIWLGKFGQRRRRDVCSFF